jgi:hypothetical protein
MNDIVPTLGAGGVKEHGERVDFPFPACRCRCESRPVHHQLSPTVLKPHQRSLLNFDLEPSVGYQTDKVYQLC